MSVDIFMLFGLLSLFGIGFSQMTQTSDCSDDPQERCFALQDVECVGNYTQWARLHCQLRCGYCPDGKWLPCIDEIDDCDEIISGACEKAIFGEYMLKNCRKTCNFCTAPTAHLTNITNTLPSTQVKDWCVDDPTVDCWHYGDTKCLGKYSAWAKLHCPFRCGYCPNYYPKCIDTISYCNRYDKLACQTEYYGGFMRRNCRGTCNLCTYPAQNMAPISQQEAMHRREVSSTPTHIVSTSTPTPKGAASHANIKLSFCDFESPPYCNYTQDGGDSFDWSRGSSTLQSSTGPKQDHTYGNPIGHYMYLDAYNQAIHVSSSRTSYARITSPEFPPANGYCILFWYNMHGSDIKDFKMYAKVGNELGYPVFQHSGEMDENWHLAKVNLYSEYTANPFRIVFEGNTNGYRHYYHSSYSYYNRNGNIAIDDFYAYNTSCNNIPSFPQGTYTYTNGSISTYYTFHSTPMSWNDAQIECKKEGSTSHLISVNSQEEQEFIVNTIKASESLHSTGMYGFYTSGNDERSERTFDWTDTGTPYTTTYQNWHPGQPNNVGGNQNCLLLQYPETWEWGDVNCKHKYPFICEINNI